MRNVPISSLEPRAGEHVLGQCGRLVLELLIRAGSRDAAAI